MELDHLRRAALFNATEQWLESKPSPCTKNSYRKMLAKFASWAAEGDREMAVERLCTMRKAETEQVLRAWTSGWSPTYGGTGRVAISSLIAHMNEVGLCPYIVEGLQIGVLGHVRVARRDAAQLVVTVPLLAYAKKESAEGVDEMVVRDYALLRLIAVEGMRRTAIGKIPQDANLSVFSEETERSIAEWKKVRGGGRGTIFIRTDRDDATKPLSGESIRRMVLRMCAGAGVDYMCPEVLRKHAAAAKSIGVDMERLALVEGLASVGMQIGFMTKGVPVDAELVDAWNESLARLLSGGEGVA